MQNFIIIILLVLFGMSCVKDKPQAPIKTVATINPSSKILVINEGNFGWGNASVSLVDTESGTVVEDYYKQQNNNSALGDVCQSMVKHQNYYYLVINNSNKIIEVNANDFTKTTVISGFNSPRYLLPITHSKAYVSDLYANSIQVVNLTTKSIEKTIPCAGWTEQMAVIYNKVFVTNVNSNYCYVVNSITDVMMDSIEVGKGASSLVFDKNDKLWILASGNTTTGSVAQLVKINPVNLQIEQTLLFNAAESPQKLCLNTTKDTLYYLSKGVFRLPISSNQLPSQALINAGSKLYYGLGINPKDYRIYVADAIDYVQKSKVEVYNSQGQFIKSFNTGVISSQFMFE